MINVYFSELPKTLTEILGLKYDETCPYDQRVKLREEYIKEQLKINPNYEGWDYIEHFRYKRTLDLGYLFSREYLISTKGRVLSARVSKGKYITIKCSTSGPYSEFSINRGGKKEYVNKHRVVGCTFIQTDSHPSDMFVNHKDLNKRNDRYTNLEWTTPSENSRHGVKNQAYSQKKLIYFDAVFKGTWIIEDKYKGTEFKIHGTEELIKMGLFRSSLKGCILGKYKTAYGCTWEFYNEEEHGPLPNIPEFIKNKFMNDKDYVDERVKPIKATVKRPGELYGKQFTLMGKRNVKETGFNQGNISIWIGTGRLVQGCLFEYISRDEAELLPRGLTKEQMKYLGLKSKYIQNK